MNELADLHEFLGYPMDKYRTVSVERMVEVATFRLAKDFEAPGSEFYPGELAEAEAESDDSDDNDAQAASCFDLFIIILICNHAKNVYFAGLGQNAVTSSVSPV